MRVAVACMYLAASRKLVGDLRNLKAFRWTSAAVPADEPGSLTSGETAQV